MALSAFRLNEAFKKEPNIPVVFLVWRKFAEWYNWLRGKLHFKRFEAIERVVGIAQTKSRFQNGHVALVGKIRNLCLHTKLKTQSIVYTFQYNRQIGRF